MRALSIEEIAGAAGGSLLRGVNGAVARGVSTDSRSVAPGDVFFALRGANFDGHRFVKDAFLKGAVAAVVDSVDGFADLSEIYAVIKVEDTLKALGGLAAYVRGLYKIPFVAVTGSAGKTTTKEMTASILGRSKKVLKTEGNKNNLIGLPLTIFRLDSTHEAAVVELGISETWEMERLVSICRPDVAVITNIGSAHLKTLGTIEGVARAKGPLFTTLPPHGVKAVNLDDPWVVRCAGDLLDAVTYSMKNDADVVAEALPSEDGFSGARAVYRVRGRKVSVRFSVPGATNVINGAAAIAATLPLGVTITDMEEGLNDYTPVKGRMGVLKLGDITVLDDTYNANPESMSSALRTLKEARGRKVAVLGDMLELGDAADSEHRKIGRLAGELGINVVVAIGGSSGKLAEGAREAGVKSVYDFRDKIEALKALRKVLNAGDSVLVKGSRGVALEDVVEDLKKGFMEGALR